MGIQCVQPAHVLGTAYRRRFWWPASWHWAVWRPRRLRGQTNPGNDGGYVLVQQALGHLAHDPTSVGIELATEKIDDALSTPDRDGVDVNELQKAKTALEAGQVSEAQALLQRSIATAVSQLQPAVGEESGTKVVLSPLPGRSGLTGTDGFLLAVSVLLLLLGVGLAWLFRPRDNIRELRRNLKAAAAPSGDAPPGPLPRDAS